MSTTAQQPKPERRWYQFSLRTLLVVITVATLAFGGWVQYMRLRAQENRERVAASEMAIKTAVTAIEELGGVVTSEYEERRPPTWLEEQFDDPGGSDDPTGLLKVTAIDFYTSTDSNPINVTDARLEHLKEMPHLQFLDLTYTGITDAGLQHLKELTELRSLSLFATDVTGVGMKHLNGLSHLESLDLRNTKVTDAGLEHLKGLTQLQTLHLRFSKVTDAGLEHLQSLTNLTELSIGGDHAELPFGAPPLDHANITNAGLDHLNGMTSLTSLEILSNEVSDERIAKLKKVLPKCSITRPVFGF